MQVFCGFAPHVVKTELDVAREASALLARLLRHLAAEVAVVVVLHRRPEVRADAQPDHVELRPREPLGGNRVEDHDALRW